jgi:hypothetical protein
MEMFNLKFGFKRIINKNKYAKACVKELAIVMPLHRAIYQTVPRKSLRSILEIGVP